MARGPSPRGYFKASYAFTVSQVKRMDAIAEAEQSDRSTVARQLIDLGLKLYDIRHGLREAIEEEVA